MENMVNIPNLTSLNKIIYLFITYVSDNKQAKTQNKNIKMSSLPDVFRTIQSDYIRPTKQGGIYALKCCNYTKELAQKIQPEQFYSVKWSKMGESRIGTSHTIRTQHISSLSNTRNIASSQSNRKIQSRRSFSRPQSQSIRKDIFANYGSSRVTFVIGETTPPSIQQAQSLLHQLNETVKQSQQNSKNLSEITLTQTQLHQDLTNLNLTLTKQIQEIEQNVVNELQRLRKMLSNLRRNSGMDTKVNRTDVDDLGDNLRIIGDVMGEIQGKVGEMYGMCFR